MRAQTLRLASLAALAVSLLAPLPGAATEQLDWCAPVVVRPDQRWWSYAPCEAWWKPDTIAQRADFVLDGFVVPSPQPLPPDFSGCFGANSQANSRAYHDDLRARAASRGRTLQTVLLWRFDLVDRQMAAAPGFDASFLLPSARSWSDSTDFFTKDTTEPCVCGCAFSPERGPSGTSPAGTRLKDLIDASGGPGTYQTKVQYAIRPSTGGAADGAPRTFYGSSALADQRNPAYRAWMIGQARAAMAAGGFDLIVLNHKLHQYLPSNPPSWWGGAAAPDVAAYLTVDDTPWSSPPAGYGYADYVQSWAALATDLVAAGVPFVVQMTPEMWRASSLYDDPATTALNEAAVLRGVARQARTVLLERGSGVSQAEFDLAKADIETGGVASVVEVNQNCGYGGPDNPQNPLPALSGQLAVTPDAGAVLEYAGRSILVRPFGTATGPWSADFWCHCASQPCGAPDASVSGISASSWTLPASTCDARWNAGVGSYTPRARITRASTTIDSTDRITVCQPACSNGRDDDLDGYTDHPQDPGCAKPNQSYENLQCDNAKDDDGDGLVDLADPGCVRSWVSRESPLPTCGALGIEAVAPLAALAAWRARRRASTLPTTRARARRRGG